MDTALLSLRLLLVAVFLVAGAAKLADRQGSRKAMIDFGLPAALATPLGILLPLAELVVAVALTPMVSAWWGAVGALALLVLFIIVISFTLARGRTPDCHCFGQLHSEPVGWSTLFRNGLLAIAAGFLVWQGRDNPGPSLVGWMSSLTSSQIIVLIASIALLMVLATQGWLLINLMRQNGRLLLRMDELEAQLRAGGIAPRTVAAQPIVGLPVGSKAPAFELPLVSGGTLTLDALRIPGKPVLLIFSDPHCGPCMAMLADISRWQQQYAETLTLALISRGSLKENRAKSAEFVLLQKDREVAVAYQSNGTPGAVLVRPDGTVGSPLAMGADAIKALVARTTEPPADAPILVANGTYRENVIAPPNLSGLKIGEPAPQFTLPDLNGKLINLTDLKGHQNLLLFWNPGCGYCTRMLADLKAWESNSPKGAPQLLVISTGTVEANRAMGLRSTVLLDQGFTIGRAYSATGTPSAVLVDADGKVASQVVVGAHEVLALAGVGGSGPLKRFANVTI